jgi:tartrate dehydrogenase/decarboxylase/D-malate dehydrogenase
MLLDDLGYEAAAKAVREALAATLTTPVNHTPDLGGSASTSQLGAAVLHEMETR